MTNNSNAPAKKPIFRKSLPGGLSIAVFENEYEGRKYRSVNFQRSYRKNGNWVRSGMYLDHDQVPFAIEILQGTLEFLNTGYGAIGTTPELVDIELTPIDNAEIVEAE